jgi:hypothetical protein
MNYGFGYTGGYYNNTGEVVSIFTTSGGQSGSGFTGALAGSFNDYTRLITQIGAGPGCALGNCCGGYNSFDGTGWNCYGNMLGSIVDIPNDKRAAIVRNTVSGW